MAASKRSGDDCFSSRMTSMSLHCFTPEGSAFQMKRLAEHYDYYDSVAETFVVAVW